jgi:hypothetical protein
MEIKRVNAAESLSKIHNAHDSRDSSTESAEILMRRFRKR